MSSAVQEVATTCGAAVDVAVRLFGEELHETKHSAPLNNNTSIKKDLFIVSWSGW